jgi:hypothetical protein
MSGRARQCKFRSRSPILSASASAKRAFILTNIVDASSVARGKRNATACSRDVGSASRPRSSASMCPSLNGGDYELDM